MFTFKEKLAIDSKLQDLLNSEIIRQSKEINLIASENIASKEVMALTGISAELRPELCRYL